MNYTNELRMWAIPNPYDYHEQGELVILAATRKEALAKFYEKYPKYDQSEADHAYGEQFQPEKITEIGAGFYYNHGCDC